MTLYVVILKPRGDEHDVTILIDAENRAAAIKNVFVALAKKSKASGYSDYWSTSTETVRVLRVEYDFTKAVPK